MIWFVKASEKGCHLAQYFIGEIYQKGGYGIEQNYKTAREYYLKAAEKDHTPSQYCLGMQSFRGQGADINYLEALTWFEKTLKSGFYEDTHYTVGFIYQIGGYGVETDYKKAIFFFGKAIENGNTKAMLSMGDMYMGGFGMEKDHKWALYWYEKAAENNNFTALTNLGRIYGFGYEEIDKDFKKAYDYTLRAADLENVRAQLLLLGAFYYNGIGTFIDVQRAMDWYIKAANQGSGNAMNKIGFLFENGYGVDVGYGKAMEWYKKAITQGYSVAYSSIGHMYQNGYGVTKDPF
ncbi:unnamed protein product [Mucor hiemalis]